jgi:hypothetical protein
MADEGVSTETGMYGTDQSVTPSDFGGNVGYPSAGPIEGGNGVDAGYAAGGGYLSSSGILAPYHKKLIDGLYAGGRINY